MNRWIVEYNREATGVQLDLGRQGVEGDPMVGEVGILLLLLPLLLLLILQVKHVYSEWKEPSIDRKLHFSAGVKAMVGVEVVEVFKNLDREGIICEIKEEVDV